MKVNRFFGFFFSLMPGAMHLYAGYMKQGLQLMGTFLTAVTLGIYIGVELYAELVAFPMMILAIMVWFFSFFDGLRLNRIGVRIEPGVKEENTLIIKYIMDSIGGKYSFVIISVVGVFLILSGIGSFANRFRWYGGDFYHIFNMGLQFVITLVICAVGVYLVKHSKTLGELFKSKKTYSEEAEDEELKRLEELLKRELSENDLD